MLLTFSVFSAHLNFEISSGGCGGAVGLSYNIGTNPHPLNKKTVFSVVVVAPVAFVDDDDSVGEFTWLKNFVNYYLIRPQYSSIIAYTSNGVAVV